MFPVTPDEVSLGVDPEWLENPPGVFEVTLADERAEPDDSGEHSELEACPRDALHLPPQLDNVVDYESAEQRDHLCQNPSEPCAQYEEPHKEVQNQEPDDCPTTLFSKHLYTPFAEMAMNPSV